MSKLSFQLGTEIEQKPNVLTWRLPKRPAANAQPVSERNTLVEKSRPDFGRRTTPPVGASGMSRSPVDVVSVHDAGRNHPQASVRLESSIRLLARHSPVDARNIVARIRGN